MADIHDILNERSKTHGDFTEQAALSAGMKLAWGRVIAMTQGMRLTTTAELTYAFLFEGADMIMHKLSRAAAGNALESDHWRDIAGYATLVADRLEQMQMATQNGQKCAEQAKENYDAELERPHHRPSSGGNGTDPHLDFHHTGDWATDRPHPSHQLSGPECAASPGVSPRPPQGHLSPLPSPERPGQYARGLTGAIGRPGQYARGLTGAIGRHTEYRD